jgi:hypothetical protein
VRIDINITDLVVRAGEVTLKTVLQIAMNFSYFLLFLKHFCIFEALIVLFYFEIYPVGPFCTGCLLMDRPELSENLRLLAFYLQ